MSSSEDVLKILHEKIEHRILTLEFLIASGLDSNSSMVDQGMQSLVQDIKELLDKYFDDVSVNIKMVDYDEDEDYEYLKTIARAGSDNEKNLRKRTRKERFSIEPYINIQKLKEDFPEKKEANSTLSVNSAYLDIIQNASDSEWICNDLTFATKVKHFYSNSFKYSDYYNSLAVFPISDKHHDESKGLPKVFRGLLIFDTSKTKLGFEPNLIKHIGGLISHRLNDLLAYLGEPFEEA